MRQENGFQFVLNNDSYDVSVCQHSMMMIDRNFHWKLFVTNSYVDVSLDQMANPMVIVNVYEVHVGVCNKSNYTVHFDLLLKLIVASEEVNTMDLLYVINS